MVYLDSNVFIYPVIYDESIPLASKSKIILMAIEEGKIVASTSLLTWDEVVWVVLKILGREDALMQGRKLLGFPKLQFIEVDEAIILKAQSLIESYNLKPRDAIHAASALLSGSNVIVSEDRDFDVIKELKRISITDFADKISRI